MRTTAPSSPCSRPTIRSPSAWPEGRPARTRSSSPGGTLQAQPPPEAYCVRRCGSSTWVMLAGGKPLTLGYDGVLRVARRRETGLEDTEAGDRRCDDIGGPTQCGDQA